ncbi:MAG: fimbrial assembly protein [Acidobacteriaceae bacterium]
MRITLNLASRPYVELRPLYSRLRLWMLILALAGAFLGYQLHMEQSSAAAATAHVASLHKQIRALENQQQSYRNLMAQPENAATLKQSEFLNTLFRRKAFSWTATMEDLETVLPSGVQVVSLQPLVRPNGKVILRLRVLGPRDRGVDLIRNLEKSRYFALPRLASESLATQGGDNSNPSAVNANMPSYVNFDILADYRPLPHPVPPADESSKPSASHPAATHHTPAKQAHSQKEARHE